MKAECFAVLFNQADASSACLCPHRGCVIGPTFHFNVPSLRFGDVSFGECALGLDHGLRSLCITKMERFNLRASVTRVSP